jgi:hypothetical protein
MNFDSIYYASGSKVKGVLKFVAFLETGKLYKL